ncbi:RIP metalloprotease RseP [Clostridium frigidicarnis]|uniref:Zinc metalloprotease n=1 Tax=Clostridium frigidicarnis TaxID=84698 RepID=A0A1I0WMI5_9CLOT|nr:RIP metalloprotease RseP [Clostridium frigidicarnis]SFA89764.1 regulator of sigma E protease [Clostridium frigidicarnis]
MYFVIALLALGVLIIIHELGHFIMAKVNGVTVEEFSIGMGPKLFAINGGKTQYTIRILPIGGYVKMHGESEEANDEGSFSKKSPLQRISIILAGPIMNLILPIIIYTIIALSYGYSTTEIKATIPDSPAETAKILSGDKITKINDKKVSTWEDLSTEIYTSKDSTLKLEVKRNDSVKEIKLTPELNAEENRYMIGIEPARINKPSFGQSIVYGLEETKSIIKQTFTALKTLVTGKASFKTDVGGPVSMIRISGAAAKAGIVTLLTLVAYISIQLAIFNLIPFPALDGGWTLLLLIELISGKKVNDKIVGTLNYIGFSILLLLMFLVTIKDILFPIKL